MHLLNYSSASLITCVFIVNIFSEVGIASNSNSTFDNSFTIHNSTNSSRKDNTNLEMELNCSFDTEVWCKVINFNLSNIEGEIMLKMSCLDKSQVMGHTKSSFCTLFVRGPRSVDCIPKEVRIHRGSLPTEINVCLIDCSLNSTSLRELDQNILKFKEDCIYLSESNTQTFAESFPLRQNKSIIFPRDNTYSKWRSLRKQRDVRRRVEKKTLLVLGLFEFSQNNLLRSGGKSEEMAAKIALDDINSRDIVQGYRLVMHTNDTQCDPGTGVDAFFHALYDQTNETIVSLLGTACSEVTERLAKVATFQNIVQVSFGSTSPSLSDRKEFPFFYRTVAPVSSHSEAIIELIRHFQWDTVTFFTKNENRFTMTANFLASELEKTNVTCNILTFSISDYRDQLEDMKKLDSRIIIANFGSDVAPLVFCEIYRMGMFGSDYAWILIGEPENEWWRDSSSPSSPHLLMKNSSIDPKSLSESSPSSSSSSSKRQRKRDNRRRRRRRNIEISSHNHNQRSEEEQQQLEPSYYLSSHSSLSSEEFKEVSSSTSSSPASLSGPSLPSMGYHRFVGGIHPDLFGTKGEQEKQSQLVHEARAFPGMKPAFPRVKQRKQIKAIGEWESESESVKRDLVRKSKLQNQNQNQESSFSFSSSSSTSSHPGRIKRSRSWSSTVDVTENTQFSGPIKHSNSPSNPRTLGLKSRGKSSKFINQPQSECSYKQLTEAVQYAIIVDRYNRLEQPSHSGMTTADFMNKLENRLLMENVSRDRSEFSPFAPEAYDAAWTVALGLQKVQEKYGRDVESLDNETFAQNLKTEIGNLSFMGISGPIRFTGSDRVGITSFMQVQDGKKVEVGLLFPEGSGNKLDLECKNCKSIRWHGNQVPISRRVFLFKLVRVNYSFFVTVAVIASSGMILAAFFLAFNLYHRKLKYIKLSSPKLNNVVILGCMFAYLAVILLGTDFTVPEDHFAYICTIRAYLLSMAFSLAFGAMFAKTYRVYRIFTRSCIGVVKNKLLKDAQLMTLIMVLVLIDCIIVTSWALFDPMHINLRNLTLEIDPSDRTVVYQPQIEVCRSQHAHVWLSVLYGYKSLLLVVGLYMAWETRHVKIQALNDSKYIGLCVYIVVLTSVLAVSLANLISERVTLSFVSVTSLIMFATTVTLCLLFLPKIHAIINNTNASDPIVESMGLKIECNTRRFIVEDTKELLFRAEVQNRVFKRQIEAMDVEIWRLEHLLEHSPSKFASDKLYSLRNHHNAKEKKSKKRGSGGGGEGGEDLQLPQDDSESSDENDSTSEIYTVYLHGPKFIVPISLFNFKNNRVNFRSANCGNKEVEEITEAATSSGTNSSSAPRSSWPNSRTLWPSSNGLIRKKHLFKSEPRLQDSISSTEQNIEGTKRTLLSLCKPTYDIMRRSSHQPSVLSPPTIIQWEEGEVEGGIPLGDPEDDEEMLRRLRGNSSNGSPSAENRSRKASSASGTGSKRSSIFSAFKNPWAYITGIMKGNDDDNNEETRYNAHHRASGASSNDMDSGLLKPIQYFGGQSRLSVPGAGVISGQPPHKFSSVPDLWAVRGSSPDAEILRCHKKHSVNSDTAVVGSSGAVVIPSSAESVDIKSDPDPVLKLIIASHESVYL